jgi:hypothetical protein
LAVYNGTGSLDPEGFFVRLISGTVGPRPSHDESPILCGPTVENRLIRQSIESQAPGAAVEYSPAIAAIICVRVNPG